MFLHGPGSGAARLLRNFLVIVLASGRLLNLGCAPGLPSFEKSYSFAVQVLAQLDLLSNFMKTIAVKTDVRPLPRQLDAKVAKIAHSSTRGGAIGNLRNRHRNRRFSQRFGFSRHCPGDTPPLLCRSRRALQPAWTSIASPGWTKRL